jgi:hypothetical protein
VIETSSVDEPKSVKPSHTREDPVNSFSTSRAHLLISNDLFDILKSIQSLTITHKPINTGFIEAMTNDYRAMCRGIQSQLELLYAKSKTISKVEQLYNLAAWVYIDQILLHSPPRISAVAQELNGALTEVHNTKEEQENKVIFTWVFGMAAAEVAIGIGSQNIIKKATLVIQFNEALSLLEGLSI